jgi:uncharacterized protein (TIGR03084 family)
MPAVSEIAADLAAEHHELEEILTPLGPDQWALDTPSPGWTVADQVGHLSYFDRTAALAITDPEGFKAYLVDVLDQLSADGTDFTLSETRSLEYHQLLDLWNKERVNLIEASQQLHEDTRLPWYGPDMGAKSFLTARLMETWAHGQDICDTVGVTPRPTDRLRHIAQLGVITRGWSYINRGMEPNPTPVLVTLTAPSGAVWDWGQKDAAESITGAAVEFGQVVTQRRNLADTDLTVVGAAATEWMTMAQAFAGGPTNGPKAGTTP